MDAWQALLEEQKAYYEARAAEYDEWWERRGRYDLGPAGNQAWRDEIADLHAAFDALALDGEVLEVAAGTGNWTRYLAGRARHVTALDASAAALACCRAKLARAGLDARVSFEQRDVFAWRPARRYDVVFAAFFLSHVPAARVAGFLAWARDALAPGGLLVLLEGQGRGASGARVDDETELRELNDGRRFRIVKRHDSAAEWARHLAEAGLDARIGTTREQFMYAVATARA